MPCPAADVLDRYLAETPRPGDDTPAAIEAHLFACPACNQHLIARTDDPQLNAWLRPAAPTALGSPRRPGDLGTLDGFDIEAEIGAGGMGVVYRARDAALGRAVAVKVLRPGATDDAALARFAREAAAAAGLRHDHLVPVYAVGRTAAGAPYAVMPLVPGPTLRQRLRADPPLTPREAAELVRQVADGLAAAHAAGLVHRDVKPSNVLLDPADGRAKLTDFGLARRADPADALTRDGVLAGTPDYMAPEQADRPDQPDPRSDVYALGATLYECLTGVPPFRGTLPEVLDQHRSADPVPPARLNPRVHRDLQTVCLKCLTKDPGRRYSTAASVRDDLDRFLAGKPVTARPAGPLERAGRWVRRHPWPAAFAAAVLLLAGAAGGGVVVLAGKNRQLLAARTEADEEAQLSRETLDRVVGFGRRLWAVPQAEPVLLDAVRESVGLHRRLHDLRPADADTAAGYAGAMLGQAALQVHYKRHPEATATLDAVQAFLDGQRATAPDDRPLGLAAVRLAQTRATLALARGDRAGSLAHHSAAAREAERLVTVHGELPEALEAGMWEQNALANTHPTDPKARADHYRRAVALADRWRAAAPASADAANGQAVMLDQFSTALTEAGDLAGAATACDRAEAAYADPLLAVPGTDRQTKSSLADGRVNRGWLALKAGDPATADAKFAEALALRRELAAALPNDPARREAVLFVLVYRAKAVTALGRPDDARHFLTEARGIGTALAREYPAEEGYRGDVTAIDQSLARLPKPAGR